MGTVLQVTVVSDSAQNARALVDESFVIARHWDAVLTTWSEQGELRLLNATAGHGPAMISNDLHAALTRMVVLSAATAGAFDPGVGPLVESLRHDPRAAVELLPGALARYHIATALTLSPQHAELVAGAAIDAGGIGKGMALDAIAGRLKSSGAVAAFLDFGGSSLLAFGTPENGDAWWVALSASDAEKVLGTVALRDAALSTSRALACGDLSGSIVDPRTLRCVTPPRLATVIAADATTAEAWSTALIVTGTAGIRGAGAASVEALIDLAGDTTTTQGFPLQP